METQAIPENLNSESRFRRKAKLTTYIHHEAGWTAHFSCQSTLHTSDDLSLKKALNRLAVVQQGKDLLF